MTRKIEKIRLDQLLVKKNSSPTREKAKSIILSGKVRVQNTVADKPGRLVSCRLPSRYYW